MAGFYEYWCDPITDEPVTSVVRAISSLVGSEKSQGGPFGAVECPGAGKDLVADPISRLVNSVRNNGVELSKPMPSEEENLLL